MAESCFDGGLGLPVPGSGSFESGDEAGCDDSPFIHRFQTPRAKYVYDVNTRRILRVSDPVWEVLEDYGHLSEEQVIARYASRHDAGQQQAAQALEEIASARKDQGLFLSCRPDRILPAGKELIEERLQSRREQLILNVTDSCNFRCGYCVYGGTYQQHREHATRAMSWEVAKLAVDDFLSHSQRSEDRVISFYGGEPLLNLPLIRQAVQYVRRDSAHQAIRFAMTTNGSLLSGEAAAFLAENDFAVSVSLDGPQVIHDRFRRTALGEGSWSQVIANLRGFVASYPQYRTNAKLRFSAVATASTDLCQVQAFFESSDLFTDAMSLGVGEQKDLSGSGRLIESDPLAISARILRENLLEDIKAGGFRDRRAWRKNWVEVSAFEKPLILFHKRGFASQLPKSLVLLNTCIPGARRTFVGSDGQYYACERVGDSAGMVIGNVWDGVDAAKVASLLEGWTRMSASACRHCWCLPTCTVGCFASIGEAGEVTQEAKHRACALCRRQAHQLLVDYCMMLEENPGAMDYADAITVS